MGGTMGAMEVAETQKGGKEGAGGKPAIIRPIVRSDRGAADCGADQAGADAPAEAAASRLCLGGGGSKAARQRKRGQRKGGNSGLDRHEKLHPVVGGPLWSHAQLDGGCSIPVRFAAVESKTCDIC